MEARAARWDDWSSIPKLDGSCEVPRLSTTMYRSGESCGVGNWSGLSSFHKVEFWRKVLAVRNHCKQGTVNPSPFPKGWQWQVEFACHPHGAMFLEPRSSGQPAWCYHHEGRKCFSIALGQIKREANVYLWSTLNFVHWALNLQLFDHRLASVSACLYALLMTPKQRDITPNLSTRPCK